MSKLQTIIDNIEAEESVKVKAFESFVDGTFGGTSGDDLVEMISQRIGTLVATGITDTPTIEADIDAKVAVYFAALEKAAPDSAFIIPLAKQGVGFVVNFLVAGAVNLLEDQAKNLQSDSGVGSPQSQVESEVQSEPLA